MSRYQKWGSYTKKYKTNGQTGLESFESAGLKNFEEYDRKKSLSCPNTLWIEIWMLLVKAQKEERKFQRNPKQFRESPHHHEIWTWRILLVKAQKKKKIERKKHVLRNRRTRDPCHALADSSVELSFSDIESRICKWKSGQLDVIFKESVEDGFLLMFMVECKKRDKLKEVLWKKKESRLNDSGNS